jgi:hypothetical protein
MVKINTALVPSVSAGNVFTRLTTDDTLNIRWLTATDPVVYSAANRPIADMTIRQLVIAKSLDNIGVNVGRQNIFPFLVQPYVVSSAGEAALPTGWIWDLSMSIPCIWQNVRLAKIIRLAGGTNAGGTNGDVYDGTVTLIFSGSMSGSTTEVGLFKCSYEIDNTLSYQKSRISLCETGDFTTVVDSTEANNFCGFVTFRTLDTTDTETLAFLDIIEPSVTADNAYYLSDTAAGGTAVTDDFSATSLSHGTGLILDGAVNSIPDVGSSVSGWLEAFNFPFDAAASRLSVDSITIPVGLFREFDICAPAGDEPTGDTSGEYYPVWVSKITRVGTGSTLRFTFSTYNITDVETGGAPSTDPVDFGYLDLSQTNTSGEILAIVPNDDLLLGGGHQGFGRGHVVLSNLWGDTSGTVSAFFDAFDTLVGSPIETAFAQSSTRLSNYGISRVPKYIPTIDQSRALLGSTDRLTTPIEPSINNRYVCEQDQGLGNQVDVQSVGGITTAIENYGYTGSLCHRCVKLVVDQTKINSDSGFYDTYVLPKLTVLLGRLPLFGDVWYNGTSFLTYNGDSWQS